MLQARWIGFLCLGITALGWGLNWPAMKVLLREWPPLFSRGIAGTVAALILAAITVLQGQRLTVPRHAMPRLVFASFTNVFAWMGFSTIAMQWLSVGEGALTVYTMPIWATLLAWPLLGDRPTVRDVAALILALAGIWVLLGGHGLALGQEKIVGLSLALAAAVLFALGTVLNRSAIPLAPIPLAAWQVGLGCVVMVVLGLIFEWSRITAISGKGLAVLVYMTIVPMGVCYLTWFEALRRLPPSVASTAMLMVPLLGVISASLTLGEPLGVREAVAIVLTLGGVALAMRKS